MGGQGEYAGASRRAWAMLALIAVAGCAGAAPRAAGERSVARAETFWLPYVQPGETGKTRRSHPEGLRGKLFTLRVDDRWLTTSTWVKCPLEASYHYEALEGAPQTVEFSTVEDTARFLPHGYQFFADTLGSGGQVRIRYVVAGRYVLDGEQAKTAGIVCNAATHYAKSIAVGAYRVELMDGRPAASGPRIGATRVEVEGTLEECAKKAKGATAPVPGCNVPLAYELRPLVLARGQAKLHVSDTAGPSEIPSTATMPRSMVTGDRVMPAPSASGACPLGFEPSSDPEADVRRLGADCARGMEPMTGVLTGWQDERGEVTKYPVRLEAGRCYRVFGVGDRGVADLDLGWYGPDGRLLARDVGPERWAALQPTESLCVEETGEYSLVVSVERGAGRFAVQVWGRAR